LSLLFVPAAEDALEVFGVLEVFADDRRRVRVRLDVLLEVAVVLDDVVDEPAEEGDIRSRTERNVDVRHRARAREARIDVDDRRAAALRFHHEAEADRMAFGHVRSLDDDAVSVRKVLLERRRSAPSERDPQTGDRGGVSYPRLVLDLDDPERGVELLE